MRCWCRPRSRSERTALAIPTIAAGLWLALMSLGSPASAKPVREYAVVASEDVPVDSITLSDLRRVFLLERRFWKAGQPLVVLMPPGDSRSRVFLLGKVCGTDEGRMRRMILEKMYRGEIDLAPKVVGSDEEALSFVSSSHGLVAIVPASMARSAHVRLIAIGGKLPGSDSYPLKE